MDKYSNILSENLFIRLDKYSNVLNENSFSRLFIEHPFPVPYTTLGIGKITVN